MNCRNMMQIPELTEVLKRKQGKTVWSSLYDGAILQTACSASKVNTGLNILLKGDVLAGFFSTDAGVIQKGFDYLKGFAPETLVTAVLFSMIGYFNGNNHMVQGLIQTFLVRLPMAYFMSIQPDASLTKIGLVAPVSTTVGIILNIGFFLYFTRVNKEIVSEE